MTLKTISYSRNFLLQIGVIIILSSLCFINSYDGEFVFDDFEAIVNNKDVKDNPLWNIFRNDFWGTRLLHKSSHKSYRPFTIMSFRLQYWLRKQLIPQDFHIVNIILHTIVSILTLHVFKLFLGPGGQKIAFHAAILFSVHPVHTEAVAGIVGRAELLTTLCTWLSVISYNYSISSKTLLTAAIPMFMCITFAFIGMLCKETGIVATILCALLDIVAINNIYPCDIKTFLTFNFSYEEIITYIKIRWIFLCRISILILSTLLFLIVRFSIMDFNSPKFQSVDNPASFMDSIILRIINYNYIYCLNLWLLICPEWLCFDWSMGCVSLIQKLDQRILVIVIFWFILGIMCKNSFRNCKDKFQRYIIMGLVILIIPFLPASNILFNVGFVLAERTLYIPSAGYCLLCAVGLHKLILHFSQKRKILILLYMFLIFIFCMRSLIRSNQWKTEDSLFKSALNICPLNAKVHYNIAKTAADHGQLLIAKLEYEKALSLHPNYVQAMNNLGNLLKDEGKYLEAEMLLNRAVSIQNDFAAAWMNLGIVYSALKKYNESENSYLTALSHRSNYPDCLYNLGVLYNDQKMYDRALKSWRNAIQQNHTHRRAWNNIILLLDNLGRTDEALIAANRALFHIPDYAPIYFNIANILGKANKFLEAEEMFMKAIARDSRNAIFYTNLGVLYHRWNKFEDAEKMYKQSLNIQPNSKNVINNLKKLYSLKNIII